jgi:hypothetical protein
MFLMMSIRFPYFDGQENHLENLIIGNYNFRLLADLDLDTL